MKKLVLFCAVAFAFSGCGNDDNGTPSNNCGTVTVTKNGAALTTSNTTATLQTAMAGINQDIPGRRLDINVVTPDGRLILTVGRMNATHPDINTVPVMTYDVYPANNPNNEEMLGTFLNTADNTTYMTTEYDVPGSITITSIDGANKKVSGTYNFRADKMTSSAPGDTMRLVGSFTNVCYTILP